MDEELRVFLEENCVELKRVFEKHKVYSLPAVKMISDAQFETMGLAIGQIAMLRAFLEKPVRVEREERIKDLVEKIKAQRGNKAEKQKSKTVNVGMAKKSAVVRRRRLYIGWLHRSRADSRYKQIKTKDGGGVRDFYYNDDEQITVDSLKMKARKLFFPEGVSKYGAIEDMQIDLGNYAQETLSVFRDVDGEKCTFQEYLRCRGLFASKCHVYLMSTQDDKEESFPCNLNQTEDSGLVSYCQQDKAEGPSTSQLGVFMGCSKTEMSEEFQSLEMKTSTPMRNSSTSHSPLYAPAIEGDEGTLCTVENVGDHRLLITYESVTESSFSEVLLITVLFSREQCYDTDSFSQPLTRDTPLEEYDPLENGFTVVGINKGDKCFLDKTYDDSAKPSSNEPPDFKYEFPQAVENSKRLILHNPSEIWGYDGDQLVIGVVVSCHMTHGLRFVWFRNGVKIKEGHPLCCLPVNKPGSYNVEVSLGDEREVSDPIEIRPIRLSRTLQSPSGKKVPEEGSHEGACDGGHAGEQQTMQKGNAAVPAVPVVDKEEITFSEEIGRGSFGVVFKGSWAGTDVAVKVLKLRNARRLQSVIETEVRVHGMIRHPNIVQIMAVSILKNSIYIVSEYINGRNLDEVLFGEDEESTKLTIQGNDKMNVARQISQAVAYLHNLKPPVVHRDIKPANVLVAKGSLITKLCDMGLSKVKTAQSLSRSTAIPGSPSYMAPECLLQKKQATTQSDVWSLACTLLELFTERDCWEDSLNEKKPASGGNCGDSFYDIQFLMAAMERKKSPHVLGLPSETSLQQILTDCFEYDSAQRPRAIDIVNALLH